MNKQNIKQTESGRSMVEMLGVLAIIGVLSIGGVMGYTMAMNKHRANEILDGGAKRAVVAMQQISLGCDAGDVNFSEFSDSGFGPHAIALDDGSFGIAVSSVSEPVCKNLISMKGDDVSIAVDKVEDGIIDIEADGCTDPINLVLVYNMGKSDASSSGISDGGDSEPEPCTDPTNALTCPNKASCINAGFYWGDDAANLCVGCGEAAGYWIYGCCAGSGSCSDHVCKCD